ncbi:MAG: hypothetical protein PHW69_05245 [Elusimicrobiaceae bacterium]|nr:hypothetical protein [Elusimicrobiaceae bacterium]
MASNNEIKFGTDGWRGIIAWDFTFQNVRIAAQAIADHIREDNPRPSDSEKYRVFIGYDRRFDSDLFAAEIAHILRANRIGVALSDRPVPTPAASLLTLKEYDLAVMVTASHNAAHYNGVKIKVEGRSAPDALTGGIERMAGKNPPAPVKAESLPAVNGLKPYVSYVRSRFDVKKLSASMKIPVVADYMHGSAAGILEELIPSKKLVTLHAGHDPLFGGVAPEPVDKNLADLKKAVKENKAAAGLALDGDGDRLGVIDDTGRYLTPCQAFALMLEYLAGRQKKKGKIVQAVSLGYLSKRVAQAYKLPFEEVPVGFKYAAEKMLAEDVLAGAEESGGYAWKGAFADRDGVMSALLFIQMLQETGKPLSVLLADLEKKYGKSVFLRRDFPLKTPVADKVVFAEKIAKKLPKKICGQPIAETTVKDGLKITLADGSWVLLRPSGTEPLLRLYAESPAKASTEALLDFAEKPVTKFITG